MREGVRGGEEWEGVGEKRVGRSGSIIQIQHNKLHYVRSYEIVRRPKHTQKRKAVSGPVLLPAAHLVVLLLDVVAAGSSTVRLTHLLRTHSIKVHLLHKNRQGCFSGLPHLVKHSLLLRKATGRGEGQNAQQTLAR